MDLNDIIKGAEEKGSELQERMKADKNEKLRDKGLLFTKRGEGMAANCDQEC